MNPYRDSHKRVKTTVRRNDRYGWQSLDIRHWSWMILHALNFMSEHNAFDAVWLLKLLAGYIFQLQCAIERTR